MAKAKSQFVKVLIESVVTKHTTVLVKLRALEKIEVLRYDPMLQKPCLYREIKKLSVISTQMRGFRTLGKAKYLSVSRYRIRQGLPPAPSASGPLLNDPDWSYADGTPGCMNIKQNKRYLRDQGIAQAMVEFNKQFSAIDQTRSAKARRFAERMQDPNE